jgi:hypothetical protein
MKTTSRWEKLWGALRKWWRNEPTKLQDASSIILARTRINEYHTMYGTRTLGAVPNPLAASILAGYTKQAAAIVEAEGRTRAPTLEGEVRVLAMAVTSLLEHLEKTPRVQK